MSGPLAVALVGMSGRFPGADDTGAFWSNLVGGTVSTRSLTDRELLDEGVPAGTFDDPRYVRTCAPLDGAEYFDAEFFGISPGEATITDPQHRVFLECGWSALEAAGYEPSACPGVVGVFGGCCFPTYLMFNLATRPDLIAEHGPEGVVIGNDKDSLAARTSYALGLTGPSLCVQAFSATSLTAVHLAVQSLLTFETDVALAGAAAVKVPQLAGYLYEPGGLASPDGVCRSLDAEATGTVVGNGVAVVVLKRLEDALKDGDHVHCVIRGSAVNSSGDRRAAYAMPSRQGQAEVIAEALAAADVEPGTVGYVEAHGIGSALGDAVELSVLAEIYGGRPGGCVVGTGKPNVGHLEAASGVTGLIKAALTVERGTLPPQPNLSTPNPVLRDGKGGLRVNTRLSEWPQGPGPRRAAVSSFGLGGINAHVVLEEAPPRPPRGAEEVEGPHLLVMSARSADALARTVERLASYLRGDEPAELCDVAFTLQTGRRHFPHRAVLACADLDDALAALGEPARPRVHIAHAGRTGPDAAARAALDRDLEDPLDALGAQWSRGAAVDWHGLHAGRTRHRVPLPTYPFARTRHWAEPGGLPARITPADEE